MARPTDLSAVLARLDDAPRRANQRPRVAQCNAQSVDMTYICDLPPGHSGRMHRDNHNGGGRTISWAA